MKYHDYIHSPEWKTLADTVKLRARYHCQVCGVQSDHLEVHHIVYPADLATEDSEHNLIALCRACHELTHFPQRIDSRVVINDLLAKLLVSMDILRRQNRDLHKRLKTLEENTGVGVIGSAKIDSNAPKTSTEGVSTTSTPKVPKSPSGESTTESTLARAFAARQKAVPVPSRKRRGCLSGLLKRARVNKKSK